MNAECCHSHGHDNNIMNNKIFFLLRYFTVSAKSGENAQ